MKPSSKRDIIVHGYKIRLMEAGCTREGNDALSLRSPTHILDLLSQSPENFGFRDLDNVRVVVVCTASYFFFYFLIFRQELAGRLRG